MYGVVGGGLAGLAATARLREAGHEVRLFEATNAVGGRARAVDTAGDPVERFPHYLSRGDDALTSLAADHGLDDRIAWRRGRTARYRDGAVHPLDAPWERLAYPGTGLVDAARARRLAQAVRNLDDADGGHDDDDDRDAGSDPRTDLDTTTVEAFVTDRASRATYEGYVEPVLRAEFGDRAGDVSAAWLAEWLRSWEGHDRDGMAVGCVDGSTARLADALVEAIGEEAVRTGSRVTGVDASGVDRDHDRDGGDGDGIPMMVETPTGRRVVDCEGVVVAAGPSTLRDVTGVDPGVEAIPGTCALVATDEPIVDAWRVTVEPGALSTGEDAPFGTLFAHTNLLSPERYGGDHLTYLVGRGGSAEDADGAEDGGEETVRDRWLSALEDLFPTFSSEEVRSFRVARDPAAAVVARPGERVPIDLGEAGLPGVAYAGPGSRLDRFGGSPGARIAAGVAAAEAVADVGAVADAETEVFGRGSGFEWG
ncbi:FAD-dependent oxidoreductase [Halorubrum cibi]|uniref:Protoporphyrinogen oxidase n=1 Tax=Halorubrum cibi TaxID=413815 RepID=A0A521B7J6_9EURY|nr:FAD-dependent oxidoreductase [Halorubrum cibi]SMO43053.1 Protoporphyrinogen oxidase [Halorubrum cibi]